MFFFFFFFILLFKYIYIFIKQICLLCSFFILLKKKKKKKNLYKDRIRRQQRWEKGIEKKFDPVIRVTEGFERSANKKYRYLITSYEEINPKDPRFLLTFRDIKYLKKKYPALSNDFFEVPPLILYTIKSPEPRLSKNPFFFKKNKRIKYVQFAKKVKNQDRLFQHAFRLKLFTLFFLSFTHLAKKKLFFILKKQANFWFWSSVSRYLNIEYFLNFQLFLFLKHLFLFYQREFYKQLKFLDFRLLSSFGFIKINNILVFQYFVQVFLFDFVEISYKKLFMYWGVSKYKHQFQSEEDQNITDLYPLLFENEEQMYINQALFVIKRNVLSFLMLSLRKFTMRISFFSSLMKLFDKDFVRFYTTEPWLNAHRLFLFIFYKKVNKYFYKLISLLKSSCSLNKKGNTLKKKVLLDFISLKKQDLKFKLYNIIVSKKFLYAVRSMKSQQYDRKKKIKICATVFKTTFEIYFKKLFLLRSVFFKSLRQDLDFYHKTVNDLFWLGRAKQQKLWSYRKKGFIFTIPVFFGMVQDLENISAFLLPRMHKYNLNQRNIWVFFSSRTFSCIPFKYTGYLIRNLSSKLVNKFYNEILLEEDEVVFNKQLTEGVYIEKDFTKLMLQFEKEIDQEDKEKAEELNLLDNPDPNTISLFDVDPMDFYNLEERYEFSLTNPVYNTLKFEYNALDNFYQYNYSNNVTREICSVNESGFSRIFSRNQLQLIYFQNISKSK